MKIILNTKVLFAVIAALSYGTMAYTQDQEVSSVIPLAEIEQIHRYFSEPENMVQIQVASDNTQYAWQNMSRFYQTAIVPRAGAVSELPVEIDESIGDIQVTLPDGSETTVDAFIEDNPFDAFLVVHKGRIVYERYETMRPFDKHNWFSSGKVIGATLLALLEEEGLADLSLPVSHYIKELEGTAWDNVPLRLAVDMATGLDGTEHDEPSRFDSGYIAGNLKRGFPSIEGFTNAYQWDAVFPDDGDLFKAGVGGQGLYVSPKRDAVVVFFMTGTGGEPAPAVARSITLALE